MAIKYVYHASLGPLIYDDTDALNDPFGLFAGYTREALVTDGQAVVQSEPTQDDHVARFGDLKGAEDLSFFLSLI